jgi:hypothetical protein
MQSKKRSNHQNHDQWRRRRSPSQSPSKLAALRPSPLFLQRPITSLFYPLPSTDIGCAYMIQQLLTQLPSTSSYPPGQLVCIGWTSIPTRLRPRRRRRRNENLLALLAEHQRPKSLRSASLQEPLLSSPPRMAHPSLRFQIPHPIPPFLM